VSRCIKIAVASDHRGVALKSRIVERLQAAGHEVTDLGPHDTQAVDYPDYAQRLGRSLAETVSQCGILICGSGIGMSMAANKQRGIRAALCLNSKMAELSRRHNDANVLCLSADLVDQQVNLDAVSVFLNTPFDGDRHQRRVDKLRQLEQGSDR
jgi:ribose 5-phosphate isomerase B